MPSEIENTTPDEQGNKKEVLLWIERLTYLCIAGLIFHFISPRVDLFTALSPIVGRNRATRIVDTLRDLKMRADSTRREIQEVLFGFSYASHVTEDEREYFDRVYPYAAPAEIEATNGEKSLESLAYNEVSPLQTRVIYTCKTEGAVRTLTRDIDYQSILITENGDLKFIENCWLNHLEEYEDGVMIYTLYHLPSRGIKIFVGKRKDGTYYCSTDKAALENVIFVSR